MKFDLSALVRENIKNLIAYSSARKEFSGAGEIFLDANENSFGSPALPAQNFNRYPDPLQIEIKTIVAADKKLTREQIFLGNGSDEAIDLLYRVFAEPGRDEVLIAPPTYGMYEVSANINNVSVKRVLLNANFDLNTKEILGGCTAQTKLIFLCSPNNPTGNCLNRASVLEIAANFQGILVVDEAYADFSNQLSFVEEINNYPNLVVLQTFSKAWGLAGLRVGMAFASVEIIDYLNKVKPPYNISQIAQQALLAALKNKEKVDHFVRKIVEQRRFLKKELANFSFVQKIYPSEANFLLVKVNDANHLYRFLIDQKIVVRNRSNIELCENCLRITVGTPEENQDLLKALSDYGISPNVMFVDVANGKV